MDRLTQRAEVGNKVFFSLDACNLCGYNKDHTSTFCENVMCESTFDRSCPYLMVIDRLAAYEDSGLTPAEVKDMAENAETRLLTWFESRYGFPVGKLMDLLEAKQQGRLVELPCKVGQRVWINVILGVGRCEEHEITAVSIYIGQKTDVWFNAEMVEYRGEARCSFGADQIGKTVFLTREKAEAALAADNNVGCKHGLQRHKNELGEDEVYCERTARWMNVSLGDCLGNCESEELLEGGRDHAIT